MVKYVKLNVERETRKKLKIQALKEGIHLKDFLKKLADEKEEKPMKKKRGVMFGFKF